MNHEKTIERRLRHPAFQRLLNQVRREHVAAGTAPDKARDFSNREMLGRARLSLKVGIEAAITAQLIPLPGDRFGLLVQPSDAEMLPIL